MKSLIKALIITLVVSCGSGDKPAPAKPKVSLAEKLVEVREGLPMCDVTRKDNTWKRI